MEEKPVICSSIKDENLNVFWESGKQIAGSTDTDNVRYIGNDDQPVVVKRVKPHEALKDHISFYCKVRRQKIRTPKLLSQDRKNLLMKYEAIGIKHGEKEVSSKTLVDFKHDPDKEDDNVDFLTRVTEYAISENWTDLHPANVLFGDGYLYLMDYVPVPGMGRHEIGSFGLPSIKNEDQKTSLKKERFDQLLEKALGKFSRDKVSYSGLDFLRS